MAIVAWRAALMTASFRGALFHVETSSVENGRRIVVHEFPKKDIPYPEDMGRRARQFTVRGYCITYPVDTSVPLYSTDYRTARDLLISQLETGGPGMLQLPTIVSPFMVVCQQYRMTEEERLGGYCVFDMSFVEYGVPDQTQPSANGQLIAQSTAIQQMVLTALANATETMRVDMISGQGPQGP
jgi:prophage DNA circulation protein